MAGEADGRDEPPTIGSTTAATVANPTREAHTQVDSEPSEHSAVLTAIDLSTRTRDSGRTLTTPEDALDLDEVTRLRGFALFAAFASVPFALVLLLFAGGDPAAKIIHVVSLFVVVLIYGGVVFRLKDRRSVSAELVTTIGMTGLLAVGTGLYYWGRFAPILLIVPIAFFVFALGRSGAAAISVCVVGVLIHSVLTGLALSGVLPDVGLLHPSQLSRIEDIGISMWVQSLFVGVTILGRRRRTRFLEGLKELDKAVREIAKREALLDEAKADLDRARRVRGPGRFSGQVFAGYELGIVIGKGGIGEVYEAQHLDSGEYAAVKLLSRSSLANTELVNRFYRELEIASELKTEHVVKVLQVSDDDAPVPFLVMELLSGETLSDRLRRVGRLTLSDSVTLVTQMCDAASSAHGSGIIHRDLKPRNVFHHIALDGRPIWKVLDFGVSKLVGSQTITRGEVLGTPNYMSPEQAMGKDVESSADIFSIGVIAYRCLTGVPAFSGPDIPSVLYAVVHSMPVRPSRVASVPEAIDDVLGIAMAKDAADRFDSCEEMAREFRLAVDGQLGPATKARAAALRDKLPWRSVTQATRRPAS